jgi:hypothetical protein
MLKHAKGMFCVNDPVTLIDTAKKVDARGIRLALVLFGVDVVVLSARHATKNPIDVSEVVTECRPVIAVEYISVPAFAENVKCLFSVFDRLKVLFCHRLHGITGSATAEYSFRVCEQRSIRVLVDNNYWLIRRSFCCWNQLVTEVGPPIQELASCRYFQ